MPARGWKKRKVMGELKAYVSCRGLRRQGRAFIKAIYDAYSKYNEHCYKEIMSRVPTDSGFLASRIKLVTKRNPEGMPYKEIEIPGAGSPGSPGYKAYIILMTLHTGWLRLPFERKAKGKAMVFDVKQGASMPKNPRYTGPGKRFVVRAIQRTQIKKNPFMKQVFVANYGLFTKFLEEEFMKLDREARKKKRLV